MTAQQSGRHKADALVTVIMPAFNHANYIAEALDSIFQQRHRPLEILVVDDGSTDDTASALAPYLDRVIYMRQANAGPAAARNAALARATGAFVTFLDADDTWHRDKLEHQLARFDARPELELSICRVENFYVGDPAEEERLLLERQQPKIMTGVVVQTFVARASLFARIGGFDRRFRFAEDADWYVRATEQGVIEEQLTEVLCYRRLHADNMTREWPAVRKEAMLDVAKAAIERHRNRRDADAATGPGTHRSR